MNVCHTRPPAERYCQYVRFSTSTLAPATVYFTVKDGSGSCLAAGAPPLSVTLNGLAATCQGPRTVNGQLAGCGTGDQPNEW